MNNPENIEQGRIIRMGLGWADVSIARRIVRVRLIPGSAIHVGSTVRVMRKQAIDTVPTQARNR